MCGICGIVDLAGGVDVADVEAMCRSIAHRGPDGQDVYTKDVVALAWRSST
jgi:asparagine synthetase B (glutamine-hydrolysing)